MRTTTRHALCLAFFLLPARLFAQGVTIQSSVDMRLQGALGAAAGIAARLSGNSMHDVPATTYISGHKLRTESANSATIIDADAGRITTIDNKANTYTSLTFDEMAAAMRRAQQSAQQSIEKNRNAPRRSATPKDTSAPNVEMNVNYKVSTDRPGEREKIAGYDAERIFMTITMQGDATPEGGQTQDVGSLVILLDQWLSKDPPQTKAMAEFQRAYAKKAGQAFKAQVQGLQGMMAANPQMKGGLEAAAKEMAKMQGTPLRSVMYFTLVPAGMQFDRTLALNDAGAAAKEQAKPKEGGSGGGLFGRLKAAAEEASKMSENKSAGPPKQSTLAAMTDEVKSITLGTVPAEMFVPPAGYREIKATETQPN